jgi:ribosomal protein S18 acetylase RimI-like enzyme
MQIEPARPDDLAQVAALARKVALEVTEASLTGNPAVRLWVARADDDSLLGFLHGWEVADELQIQDLAVRLPWRRRGLGRALLTRAREYGRARGLRMMLLEVSSNNLAACALYASFGFVATRRRIAYYANGDDAIEMQVLLEPHPLDPPAACEPL